MKKVDAVFLMNMGGARDREELKEFIYNMFKDKRIISSPIRHLLAPIITNLRYKSVWENYKLIGGSPIYKHTENLIKKLSSKIDYPLYYVMRYTSPRADEIIRKNSFKKILLFPLYPHYSTTTTASSFDDLEGNEDIEFIKVERFYKDRKFNDLIVDLILENGIDKDTNLIFSAHGLPEKIVKNGDPYEREINEHISILKTIFEERAVQFKSVNLAYQSKVGSMKWLEPSLEEVLKKFKNQKVLIYPISFIIDNSETDLELAIEYGELAKELNIDYKVSKVPNDDDRFVEFLKDKIEEVLR